MTQLSDLPITRIWQELGGGRIRPDNHANAFWRKDANSWSVSLNREKNVWKDHVSGQGGGNLDLVEIGLGCGRREAIEWLENKGFCAKASANGNRQYGAAGGGPALAPRIVAEYDYTDADGNRLYQCVRYEPKAFKQRRPNGNGGWIWDLKGVETVLYRLPAVINAPLVYVTEGEKDVHTLEAFGLVATTNPMGAGKWRKEYSETLRGKDVVFIPDTDDPGRDHAKKVAASLKGVAKSVRTVILPVKDVSEWVRAGGTKEKLEALVAETSAVKIPDVKVLSLQEVLAIQPTVGQMLFDGFPLPAHGCTLTTGIHRSGKTTFMLQCAISILNARALLDNYQTLKTGGVLLLANDDAASDESTAATLQQWKLPPTLPFHFVRDVPFPLGGEVFLAWLEREIKTRKLAVVILDSYTSLRGIRAQSSMDFVKVERDEIMGLDKLGKRLQCSIVLIHHDSKAGFRQGDWMMAAAGSVQVAAASEQQIHICRFPEMSDAPERLVQACGKHSKELDVVVRFDPAVGSYSHVIDGPAATIYPLLKQIKSEFGSKTFTPKELYQETGCSRQTATRWLAKLRFTGALKRDVRGHYSLDPVITKDV